jgi:hypothetical protein
MDAIPVCVFLLSIESYNWTTYLELVVYSFIGASSILMQLIVYIWIRESYVPSLTLTVLAGVASMGLFFTHVSGKFSRC